MDAVYTGLDSFHDLGHDKEVVMEKIEGKADSAAAVVHKLLRSPKPEQLYLKYAHDILGVVALLGDALDILASKLGISIKGQYKVICLEDISSDLQRELAFPRPALSNGETLPGIFGYAVNMIFLPAEHLQFRTSSGDASSLESREHLYMASSCIEDGVVSLDGEMMRGNGVGSEQLPLSPEKVERLKIIEDLKLELSQLHDQIQEEIRTRTKHKKTFAPFPGMYNSDMLVCFF
ncbi:hypothetical protein H5410_017082 [Solanum commersonii]|uniref:Uncharacterized protein n=1 Tax=Solanum commersonii TaxID=4109 RepID=A0A9J5ZZ13_SOLCO|nr:hypothetical protein H5410_017082 [Solanum commersonii]